MLASSDGLALLSGCAAPQATPPSIARSVPQPRLTAQQQQKLVIEHYRKETSCRGRAYAAASRYASKWLDSVVSVPTDPRRVAGAVQNGRFRIRIAEAAARKRCFDVARDTYLEVNNIFTGDPYSNLRQRVHAGLNALPSGAKPGPLPAGDVQHDARTESVPAP